MRARGCAAAADASSVVRTDAQSAISRLLCVLVTRASIRRKSWICVLHPLFYRHSHVAPVIISSFTRLYFPCCLHTISKHQQDQPDKNAQCCAKPAFKWAAMGAACKRQHMSCNCPSSYLHQDKELQRPTAANEIKTSVLGGGQSVKGGDKGRGPTQYVRKCPATHRWAPWAGCHSVASIGRSTGSAAVS